MNLDQTKPFILTVDNVLSPEECRAFIERMEQGDLSAAPINTPSGPRLEQSLRNNERVMFDDPETARMLLERVRHRAPAEIHGMRLVGANERLRCYRYRPGMFFAPHEDGAFYRNDREQSWYSYLVYLNDNFEGGETTFFVEPRVSIRPERGMGLLFQHPIPHEGSEVKAGVKYVVRTDLMYRRD